MNPTISNIYCIGRNYAEHAKELGNAIPEEPLVFIKPTGGLCETGAQFKLPAFAQRVDHEVEVVLRIGKTLPWSKPLDIKQSLSQISHFGVGIDFTARDVQNIAKKKGHPWSVAKGFEDSAAVGPLLPISVLSSPEALDSLGLELKVDGAVRQTGNTRDMLFDCATILNFLQSRFRLLEGDLIFTGTPPGVSPLQEGQTLQATLLGHPTATLNLTVTKSLKSSTFRL